MVVEMERTEPATSWMPFKETRLQAPELLNLFFPSQQKISDVGYVLKAPVDQFG
jgi:hypothetical protein